MTYFKLDDKFKPFLGALFSIGNLVYVTQVSHPQQRHKYMKEDMDFIKLYDRTRLIAVVNLNYMFPIHKSRLIEVEYKNIENFRTFESEKNRNDYITLLKREMKEIRTRKIDEKAVKLYKHKYDYPSDRVSNRCVDFKKLEQKCIEFEIAKQVIAESQETAASSKEK